MAVRLIAKDNFPHFAVASWASRAEAHETVTAVCQREATASGLFRLVRVLGVPANGNERHLARASVSFPLSGRRHLVTEFSRRRG
jgi:hypothetical protein